MYTIDIEDKEKAIFKLMQYYASSHSFVSIEGYELTKNFKTFDDCEFEESEVLTRQTTWPKLNFYILPLTGKNVSLMISEIQSKKLLHFEEGIIHIQIAKDNERVFYGCDYLHPDCTVVSGHIEKGFVERLLSEGIINSYEERVARME